MSWLFGVIGTTVQHQTVERSEAIHGTHVHRKFLAGNYYFAGGGNSYTSFASNDDSSGVVWIGTGLLVRRQHNNCVLNDQRDWEQLVQNVRTADRQNGHFVLLRHEGNRTEIRTDAIGLRTLYWSQRGDEFVFCTRLDWLCHYLKQCKVDYRQLGGRLLLFNQLTFDSTVKNVQRLGPGGSLVIENNTVATHFRPFTPDSYTEQRSSEQTISLLTALSSPVPRDGQTVSLGLSGGLDSRLLLALMDPKKDPSFQTHTFGSLLDPDVMVPRTMAEAENIPHILLDTTVTHKSITLSDLRVYAAETHLIEPVSTAMKLSQLFMLDTKNTLLVDGAFGEIARRQYLNRVEFRGTRPFRDNNIDSLMGTLSVSRGDFFADDVKRILTEGAREEISWMLRAMPDIMEIGLENYLDLWSIRARLPNYSSDEQGRLDGIMMNYMPFVQYDFAQSVFTMPMSDRKNARMFRQVIRKKVPELTKYPFVKNGTTYPFPLSKTASLIYTKVKALLGKKYSENHLDPFLFSVQNDVMDLVLSQHVVENPVYSYGRIKKMAETYYQGDRTQRNGLLWWLTFELWRGSIEGK
jgi:hypothetical protein